MGKTKNPEQTSQDPSLLRKTQQRKLEDHTRGQGGQEGPRTVRFPQRKEEEGHCYRWVDR
jgi:ribosomal protein L19E